MKIRRIYALFFSLLVLLSLSSPALAATGGQGPDPAPPRAGAGGAPPGPPPCWRPIFIFGRSRTLFCCALPVDEKSFATDVFRNTFPHLLFGHPFGWSCVPVLSLSSFEDRCFLYFLETVADCEKYA